MATLTRLQALLEDEPGTIASLAGLAASLAVPTAIRWALQPVLGPSLWFATYYPAVLYATLALGWRLGFLNLLLSALIADYLFIPPQNALSVDAGQLTAVVVFLLSGGVLVLTAALLRQAARRLNRAAETQATLNGELQHRVNNTLAIVQALAAQTIRSNPDPTRFYEDFRGRILALSAAQQVLSAGDWQACELPALPQTALAAFIASTQLRLEGPDCSIPSRSCVPLVLALHELGTNAAKYGALSVPGGQVLVRWRLQRGAAGDELVMQWSEHGGPQVEPPSRKGLGSRLLSAQAGLKAVQSEFLPDGLRCTLVVEGCEAQRPTAARAAGAAAVLAPSIR